MQHSARKTKMSAEVDVSGESLSLFIKCLMTVGKLAEDLQFTVSHEGISLRGVHPYQTCHFTIDMIPSAFDRYVMTSDVPVGTYTLRAKPVLTAFKNYTKLVDPVRLNFSQELKVDLKLRYKDGLRSRLSLNVLHSEPVTSPSSDDYAVRLKLYPQVLLKSLQWFSQEGEEVSIEFSAERITIDSYLGDISAEKAQKLVAGHDTIDCVANDTQYSSRDPSVGSVSVIVPVKILCAILGFCHSIQVEVTLGIVGGDMGKPVVICARNSRLRARFVIVTISDHPASAVTSSQETNSSPGSLSPRSAAYNSYD
ncbi:hypothetical protein Pelo_9329 [Pelomyxa schiedti]|nr:hypothetical protein Pelo_9329 [Pelomyxa schiedti]